MPPPQTAQALLLALQQGQRAFQGASLWMGELRGADLQGVDLRDADLRRADLRGATLQGADLRGARLDDARLDGADLQRADLRGATLSGASLTLARYDALTRWPEGVRAKDLGALGPKTRLHQAALRGADLRGLDLRGAWLGQAVLEGADLRGADLRGAWLEDARLQGARLEGARIESANLQNATYDASTRWPLSPPDGARFVRAAPIAAPAFGGLAQDSRPEKLAGALQPDARLSDATWSAPLRDRPAEPGLLRALGNLLGLGGGGPRLRVSPQHLERLDALGQRVAAISWERPFQVHLSVWLPSPLWLDLRVGLHHADAAAHERITFQVRAPHALVSRALPLHQALGDLYMDLSDFNILWPQILCAAALHGEYPPRCLEGAQGEP